MFQESKDLRTAQMPPATHPRRATLRRRLVPVLIAVAVVCTLVAFGIGVTAQTRAETTIAELNARIDALEVSLDADLTRIDELTEQVADQRAQNDADRAALASTEGFLE